MNPLSNQCFTYLFYGIFIVCATTIRYTERSYNTEREVYARGAVKEAKGDDTSS